jgi:hypothetical protein
MGYDIGYRRPPASRQFKKGTSGNRKGRPKGSRNFLTLLDQELAEKVVVHENGRKKSVTRLQAMVKRMVAGALQGDQKALLTLVEILRRTGTFEPAEAQGLLPDNYEAILEAYVETRRKGGARTSPSTSVKGEQS